MVMHDGSSSSDGAGRAHTAWKLDDPSVMLDENALAAWQKSDICRRRTCSLGALRADRNVSSMLAGSLENRCPVAFRRSICCSSSWTADGRPTFAICGPEATTAQAYVSIGQAVQRSGGGGGLERFFSPLAHWPSAARSLLQACQLPHLCIILIFEPPASPFLADNRPARGPSPACPTTPTPPPPSTALVPDHLYSTDGCRNAACVIAGTHASSKRCSAAPGTGQPPTSARSYPTSPQTVFQFLFFTVSPLN